MGEILLKKVSHKEQINSDYRVNILLNRYSEVSGKLSTLYQDDDGLRKEEISSISGPNEFAEFYGRLRTVKQYHRKYPNEVAEPMQMEFLKLKEIREAPIDEQEFLAEFSDEEGLGRYLDLHEAYTQFTNVKGIEATDYLTYLVSFDRLFDIPKEKKTNEYLRYITTLLDYLFNIMQRIKPLHNLEAEFEEVEKEFETKFTSGNFPGWPKEAGSALAHSGAHLDLSSFSSPEELMSLGLDRLKRALQALKLKCGGTLE